MRVFLSYGHDEHSPLAARIRRDLEGRGLEVWFDADRFRPGHDWERQIDDGLDWVSADEGQGRFVLLMTPHSVRRPDGYCLNELARAWNRRLPVVPVMVADVEPPLSIARLQYLDMRDCVPVAEHEDKYKARFKQLAAAVEHDRIELEGVQARLISHLDPLPYEPEVSTHLRFTGRKWVLAEIDRWLSDAKRRVFWIMGEAGIGKSALAAWLAGHRPEMAAFHACRHGNSDRVNPVKVLASIAYQLSTQLADYRDRLNASNLDALRGETSGRSIFERLFVMPLGGLPVPDRPVVILIDGLDEATRDGRNELASIIGTEWGKTPPWLRLVVTSRPHEEAINFPLQALDPWTLSADRPENLDDIRSYLRHELPPLSGNGEPPSDTIERIVAKSEGLFLYVHWIRQELEEGRLSVRDLDRFPQGLGGIYATFFERYFPDVQKYATTHRPVLEAVCAAHEPLRLAYLADLFRWSAYAEAEMAKAFGSLFPVSNGRIRPFHGSVRDWVTDKDRAGPYFVDPADGHRRLAEAGWREYERDPLSMGEYSLSHLPAHLAGSGDSRRLTELARDARFLRAQETRFPEKPLLPLATLESALRAAAQRDDAPDMMELLVILEEQSSRARQESPLDALRSGSVDRARALLELQQGEAGVLWGLLVAEELQDHGRSEEARTVMAALLERDLPSLNSTTWRARYAAELLAGLGDADRRMFDDMQQRLFPDGMRWLYDSLIVRGKVDAALESARRFGRDWDYQGLLRDRARERLTAGDFSGASTHVNRLPDRDESGTGLELVVAQARAGQVAEALQIVESFNPWNRAHALRQIAEVQAEQGRATEARELLAAALRATEEVGEERSHIVGYVARSQARCGDRPGARATWAIAIDLAQAIEEGGGRDVAYSSLVDSVVETGEFDLAVDLTRRIDDRSQRSFAWETIVRGLAGRGRTEEAWALAGEGEPRERATRAEAIARVQLEKGDLAGALASAEHVKGASRDSLRHALAEALGQRGELRDALEIARAIGDPRVRGPALAAVAYFHAKNGQWPAAMALVEEIDDYEARPAAVSSLATLHAEHDDFVGARTLAETIPSHPGDYGREETLRAIAAYQWHAGRRDEYRTTLASALTPHRRSAGIPDHQLRELAVRRAKARDWSGAHFVAQRITDSGARSEAFRALGETLVEDQELKKASELAASTADWRDRGKILRSLAVIQARAGLLEEALKTAWATNNSVDWAEALGSILPALTRAGQRERAKRILADTLDLVRDEAAVVQALVFRLIGVLQVQCDEGEARRTLDRAAEAAQRIEDLKHRLYFDQDIAKAALEAGQTDVALESFRDAIAIISEKDFFAVWELAEALGRADLTDLALGMIERMPAWSDRDHVQEALARGLLSRGNFDGARRVAEAIAGHSRGAAFREIANARAERGQLAEAVAMAEVLRESSGADPRDHEWALADIAEVQANRGQLAEARAIMASIGSAFHQARVLARIAVGEAKAGDPAMARATLSAALERARTHESEDRQAGGFSDILDAQLEIGDHEGALRTAAELDSRSERAGKLADIAIALARQGVVDKACEIADGLAEERSRHLPRIAAALAEAGQREGIKRLLPLAAETPEAALEFCLLLAQLYNVPSTTAATTMTRLLPPRQIQDAEATTQGA
jgi:hypothetical protein